MTATVEAHAALRKLLHRRRMATLELLFEALGTCGCQPPTTGKGRTGFGGAVDSEFGGTLTLPPPSSPSLQVNLHAVQREAYPW